MRHCRHVVRYWPVLSVTLSADEKSRPRICHQSRMPGLVTGHDPARKSHQNAFKNSRVVSRAGSEGVRGLTRLHGPGQEVFQNLKGRVRSP